MLEYRAEHVTFDVEVVVTMCNEMGSEGWRLVTALEDEVMLERSVLLIFERPVSQST